MDKPKETVEIKISPWTNRYPGLVSIVEAESTPVVKDSGARTIFDTGSQKEIVTGRGRYDLIPLKQLSNMYDRMSREVKDSEKYESIAEFLYQIYNSLIIKSIPSKVSYIISAITIFSKEILNRELPEITQALAKLYEAGAQKYSERDWEKGRPQEVFINSALRHFFQYLNGETDEDHATAAVWNLLSCADTIERLPEMAYTINNSQK